MKNTLFTFKSLFIVLALAAFTFNACKKQGCTDPDAENYNSDAKEDDGSCTYAYEKFVATYNVNESCTPSANFTYQMIVNKSTTAANGLLLINFGDFNNSTFTATVDGNSLTLPNQTVNVSGNSVNVSGSGAINGSILTITYTYSIGGSSGNCTATCTKL